MCAQGPRGFLPGAQGCVRQLRSPHPPSGRERGSGCLDLKASHSVRLPADLERTLICPLYRLHGHSVPSSIAMEEPNEGSRGLGVSPEKLGACVHSARFCCLVHSWLVDHVLPDAAVPLYLYLPRVSAPVGGRLLGALPPPTPPNPHASQPPRGSSPGWGGHPPIGLQTFPSVTAPRARPPIPPPTGLDLGQGALWWATRPSLLPDLNEQSTRRTISVNPT